jgi:pimeloyl-ACP methyl ester carboxylesterase
MAHGVTASKETLFRFGEALAAAGFVCYAVDLSGHGESPKRFSARENVNILSAVAGSLGSVDVFIGHSMGAGAGARAVRDGALSPRLFIAVGANPDIGEHGPPLLLLAGRFEELHPPALLKTRTDARLVVSPCSDHALEPFDPMLVNPAVEAACAAVGTPPPSSPPTRWISRLAGIASAGVGAIGLVLWLPPLPRKWTWSRGPLVAAVIIASVVLSTGTWLGTAPILRRVPAQILFMSITWLALAGAARLRIPWWTFSAIGTVPVLGFVLASICGSMSSWQATARFLAVFFALGALVIFAGTAIGCLAAGHASRRDGDLAMAIFIGYALGQWMPRF